MDRKYIESEHIVDRYLSGDLTVREARDFERYCLEHPDVLNEMPIPVRLKARLSRRPAEHSETGVFQAIPSSATRAAAVVGDEGFDAEEERAELQRAYGASRPSQLLVIGLGLALLGAIGGLITYGMQASSLAKQLEQVRRDQRSIGMQAPARVETYRVEPVRTKPAEPTLNLGWLAPPQLLELYVDVKEGKYNQFQITMDRGDGTRVMQLRRVARDSNRELRFALNSSAFGPGQYLIRIEGYTWRGQTEEIGWLRLGLE